MNSYHHAQFWLMFQKKIYTSFMLASYLTSQLKNKISWILWTWFVNIQYTFFLNSKQVLRIYLSLLVFSFIRYFLPVFLQTEEHQIRWSTNSQERDRKSLDRLLEFISRIIWWPKVHNIRTWRIERINYKKIFIWIGFEMRRRWKFDCIIMERK